MQNQKFQVSKCIDLLYKAKLNDIFFFFVSIFSNFNVMMTFRLFMLFGIDVYYRSFVLA